MRRAGRAADCASWASRTTVTPTRAGPARRVPGWPAGWAEPLGDGGHGGPGETIRLGRWTGGPRLAAPLLERLAPGEETVIARMIHQGVNSPVASSAGRLFDAAAALLGLRDDVTYEGEAALALEAAAGSGSDPSSDSGSGPDRGGELPWRLGRHGDLLVYHNQLLAEGVVDALAGAGLEPLLNERVPAGDGGLSYGQAAVAAAVTDGG